EQLVRSLYDGIAVTADYATQLDEVTRTMALLSRHLELTVRLDQVLTATDELVSEQVAPSLVRVIDAEAVSASNSLSQYDANSDDLNEAERHIAGASVALARMNSPQPDAEWSSRLARGYAELLSRVYSGAQ